MIWRGFHWVIDKFLYDKLMGKWEALNKRIPTWPCFSLNPAVAFNLIWMSSQHPGGRSFNWDIFGKENYNNHTKVIESSAVLTNQIAQVMLLIPSVCVGYVARSSQIAQDMLVALSRLRRVGCSQFIMIINRKAEKLHILDTLLSLQQSSDKSSACNRRSYCGIDW